MIHFICALRCEALPLIDYYRLKHLAHARVFSIYTNNSHTVSVCISGTGKLAAGAATMYSYGLPGSGAGDIWINTGIAGHREHAIGDIFLCHRITDAASNKVWYPQLACDCSMPTENLVTLDIPSTDYSDALFDMEASGFVSTASRLSSLEFTHSLKIISDNREHPPGKINARDVTALMERRVPQIVEFAAQLEALSCSLGSSIDITADLERIAGAWHFTACQRQGLGSLLHRWHLLMPGVSPFPAGKEVCVDAESVIKFLAEKLDRQPFYLRQKTGNV